MASAPGSDKRILLAVQCKNLAASAVRAAIWRVMDIQLAQTFLDIVNTGSFVRAAKRLNVSQTTVSARVRLIESQLGRTCRISHNWRF